MTVSENPETSPPSESPEFCTAAAQAAGEPIYGTAADATTVWLILEYPYAWGNKALNESALPQPVKDRLNEWTATIPGARVQLIKQQPAGTAAPDVVHDLPEQEITFFVGISDEQSSLYRFSLANYAELLTLNVPALVESIRSEAENSLQTGDEAARPYADHVHREPLYLVCTNGRRDRCCAKWGLPYYYAMREVAGDAAWQTTHTGGHRFAATMICFPQGIFYGWLTPDDAGPLVAAHQRGEIYRLDRYRGRAAYPRAVQAAECYLREETGESSIDAWQLRHAETPAPGRWTVTFAPLPHGHKGRTGLANGTNGTARVGRGAAHVLHLREQSIPQPFLQSCAKEPAPASYFAPVANGVA